MKEIKINGNKYFYKKIYSREYVNPVTYLFYVLKEESRVDIVKRKRFILFGPLVDVEVKKDVSGCSFLLGPFFVFNGKLYKDRSLKI